jgi:hypothetical protein
MARHDGSIHRKDEDVFIVVAQIPQCVAMYFSNMRGVGDAGGGKIAAVRRNIGGQIKETAISMSSSIARSPKR